jgi:hypothetical protein
MTLLREWLKTRRKVVFACFLLCVIAAGFLLIQAYLNNPYLPKIKVSTVIGSKFAEDSFELPTYQGIGYRNMVGLWVNISETDFMVGSPSSIFVALRMDYPNEKYIDTIIVKVNNAFRQVNSGETDWIFIPDYVGDSVHPVIFMLSPISSGVSMEIAYGSSEKKVEFLSAGPVELTISFYLHPPDSTNETNVAFYNIFPDGIFTKNFVLESIPIDPPQTTENFGLSLTFFAMFFASMNLSVLLYDRSKDSDKMILYEKRKKEKILLNLLEEGNEYG